MHLFRSSIVVLAGGLLVACAEPKAKTPESVTARTLVADATAKIKTLSAPEAVGLFEDTSVVFVDLREQEEIDASGRIPGSVHVPRGLLEFYIDPSTSMHLPVFGSGKRIVFYCAGGGRSALATARAMEMGLTNVAHVGGGFRAWREAGGPVEAVTAAPK
jgi:rhodanese-related sulfurtransferase